MLYTELHTRNADQHQFHFIEWEQRARVLTITLNRPNKKNALHPVMVRELVYAVSMAQNRADIWLVVLKAKGNVFCAGADLKAMAGMGEEISTTLPDPESDILLGELFLHVHKPSIAVVEGDVYAGGLLLIAGCTYVIAHNDITLGLPETKRGLFPFQVMAALLRIMPERKVLDWCIRGYNLQIQDAQRYGLITHLSEKNEITNTLDMLTQDILEKAPKAISMGLQAFAHLHRSRNTDQHTYLQSMLLQTLQSKDAQEGLAAFRQKRKPNWTNQ